MNKCLSFVLPSLSRSGGVRSTVILANDLITRGCSVRIIVNSKQSTLKKKMRGIYLHLRYKDNADWLKEFNGKTVYCDDITKFTFHRGEIIIGVGMNASFNISKITHNNVHLIQNIRGHTPWDQDLMRRTLAMDFPKIVVASYLKTLLLNMGKKEQIYTVPNGINQDMYYPAANENDRDGVGAIFGWESSKGGPTLNKYIDLIRVEFPNIQLYVFGTGKKPSFLSKSEYTRLPSLETIRQIYSKCLVWIVPSDSEGFGNPILEAMACGSVVISTDCGGPKDVLEDGYNGFIVERGDHESLFSKTKLLIADKSLRKHLQTNAFKTVNSFTWERSSQLFSEAIFKIVKDGNI